MSFRCRLNYNKVCTGCMECQDEQHYYCPVCGEKVLENVYVDYGGNVIGCENCVETK